MMFLIHLFGQAHKDVNMTASTFYNKATEYSSLINVHNKYNPQLTIVSILAHAPKSNAAEGGIVMQPVLLIETMISSQPITHLIYFLKRDNSLELCTTSGQPGRDIKAPKGEYTFMSYELDTNALSGLLKSLSETDQHNIVCDDNLSLSIYNFFLSQCQSVLPNDIFPETFQMFISEGCTKRYFVGGYGASGSRDMRPRMCQTVEEQLRPIPPKYTDLSQKLFIELYQQRMRNRY